MREQGRARRSADQSQSTQTLQFNQNLNQDSAKVDAALSKMSASISDNEKQNDIVLVNESERVFEALNQVTKLLQSLQERVVKLQDELDQLKKERNTV